MQPTHSSQISFLSGQKKRLLAVLIDPDVPFDILAKTVSECHENKVDVIFVGGSLLTSGVLDETVSFIKQQTEIPVFIFPGNEYQVSPKANGILFLSLISGRNPDFLIGKHVLAAPMLQKSGLEIIPTGYILVEGGRATSVTYMSNTTPIPADKPNIAAATALAGKMLGLQLIYMDAGSGAIQSVTPTMAKAVKKMSGLPLIIGGGIRQASVAKKLYEAGADMVVIGNGAEENRSLIAEISAVRNNVPEIISI